MIRNFRVGFLVFCLVLLSAGISPALADPAAELFVKLTCFSCHGTEGRGMIRTETKEKYRLSKKVFKKLKKANVPESITKKLKPLYKKKFKKQDKFIEALAPLLGSKDLKKYKAVIIEHGGRVYYHKGDLVKGFENYPVLAGNKEIYLFTQMKDILENRRTNGNSDAMRGINNFLVNNKITDKEFRMIAHYLSQIKR